MQRYTIFFIIVNALHVSGGFSANHQELKNYTHSIEYVPGLLAATASVGDLEPTHKLQRQKILSFIYPVYNHTWKNISIIYIYIYIYIKQD
jgi:hypothetical protein